MRRSSTRGRFARQRLKWMTIAALAVAPAAGVTSGQNLAVTHAARAIAPGEVVLITVSGPDALEAVVGHAFGQPLILFPGSRAGTFHALVGIDVDATPGANRIEVSAHLHGAPLSASESVVVQRKTFGTRKLTVDSRFVTPPSSALPRIEREQRLLTDTLAAVSAKRAWHDAFVKPVDGAAASNFGERSIFNGLPRGTHRGTDFASPQGAPIRAPNAGTVRIAQDLYYAGKSVVIDHGLGVFSLLAHMSRIDVRVGDVVGAGQIVGAVGATGRVTGPHLHWTLRIGSAAVDPLSLLALTKMP